MSESAPTPANLVIDGLSARWTWRRGRKRLFQILWLWREKGLRYALRRALLRLGFGRRDYENWIKANDTLLPENVAEIRERIETLQRRPLISLVLLIEELSAAALQCTVSSVCAQLYDNWELHIAGKGSGAPDVVRVLDAYRRADARIKVSNANPGGVAQAANAVLVEARGEFVGFLDQGDRLAVHALYMIAETIDASADVNVIYTDEDLIDAKGRRTTPQFKTEWNPDLFLSQNYFGRLTVYRCSLVASLGFRSEFEGAEEYDLALRMVEQIAPASIRHVPFVLAHRALTPQVSGTANAPAARRALQNYLDRAGVLATVEASRSGKFQRVRRTLPVVPPKVSIIIPTRDQADFLRGAVESILKRTHYPNYEIVIVDNQSAKPETLSYLASLAEHPQIRVLHFDHEFNFSSINNFAARQCQSPVLAFLNNDILIINADWLAEMVVHALRTEVGAVGAMLYYPDDAIQHAGIIVGFGGVAVNCYNGLARGSAGYIHRAEVTQNYSAVTAACLLTRSDVFAEVGGFNESDLPVAFNDVDYCLRVRERGYLVTWTPYAELYHLESVSRGDDMEPSKLERFRRDQAYMAGRWAFVLANDPYYNPNLSLDDVPFALAAVPRVRRPWKPNADPSAAIK